MSLATAHVLAHLFLSFYWRKGQAVITEKYGAHGCNVGEDGGFAPNISGQVFSSYFELSFFCIQFVILLLCICSFREGLDLVKEAISRTGYSEKIKIGIDVSATDFCIGIVAFCPF